MMNVCIIGDGVTSLSLAKNLINKKIYVDIYQKRKINNLQSNRTIGITKSNLEFFEKQIHKIPKKNIWPIKDIKIYSEKFKNGKLLNFENNNKDLFYMIRNVDLYDLLSRELIKNKFFKKKIITKNNFFVQILKKKYDLIINCDSSNHISKKYFSKKITKDYNNLAYTTFIEHESLKNNTAVQVFTKFGPIAFLPISNKKTSVVCSLDISKKEYTTEEVVDLIKKNNTKFKIKNFFALDKFKLESSNLRNYHHKNILAFGDLLHKIHPLAGQGFNMTIRDIKAISDIIQNKIDLGVPLEMFTCEEFEKKTKLTNFIFSNGIDFIYEFFNFSKKVEDKNLNKILQLLGNNKILNNAFIKLADNGITI